MKIISACLLGINCNYQAKSYPNPKLIAEFQKGNLYPICPEILGNLPIPRIPAEIQGGDGNDVLNGKAKVINQNGEDVTNHFIKGANQTLHIAQTLNATDALLTEKSPSCGCGQIFDGSFTDKFIRGDGVTTALLKKNKIQVISIKVKK
jgi:uncharacterized protein YbbK (DUF523 family)